MRCEDYDGGPPTATTGGPLPIPAATTSARERIREAGHWFERILAAPVIEHDDLHVEDAAAETMERPLGQSVVELAASQVEGSPTRSSSGADVTASVAHVSTAAAARSSSAAKAVVSEAAAADGDFSDECSSGDDLFDAGAEPPQPPAVPFVRAYGVLASWLTDMARNVLHVGLPPADGPATSEQAVAAKCEDELPWEHPEDEVAGEAEEFRAPDQSTRCQRRRLLQEMLTSAVPGSLSVLAPRLAQVVRVLGVHQSLPTAAEKALYDILVALLLRALLRADVQRGAMATSRDLEVLTDRFVEVSSKAFGLELSEIESLDALLAPPVS